MPKVLKAASETIRNLLKPPVQHSYFAMTRALNEAQMEWRDAELSSRLWQEVFDRGMDRGRILHLIYSVENPRDEEALQKADMAYLQLIDPKDP